MKKKENYLEKTPEISKKYRWTKDKDGIVTVEIDNVGLFNKIAQKFFKKPKTSYVHLDKLGSFVWPLIDGEKSVYQISQLVSQQFGQEAEPLYPRLVKYFQILESYKFIEFRKKNQERK